MEYAEILPAPSLRHLILCYWRLAGDADPEASADPALPDGSPELIFNLADPFEHVGDDGVAARQPATFLVGQITRPLAVRPTGRIDLLAVRFEAHGAAVLHADLSQLTDQWAEATTLRDEVPAMARALGGLSDTDARVAALDDALTLLVAAAPPADTRVENAVRAIRSAGGVVDHEDVARTVGLTPRTLQRLFARQVGISPKLLARIVRFQRVFAAWRDEPSRLARVAADCGYCDQSHLARDFRQFAGAAPAATLAGMAEFTAFFVA